MIEILYHFVILSVAKNLDTSSECFQILHFVQNDMTNIFLLISSSKQYTAC